MAVEIGGITQLQALEKDFQIKGNKFDNQTDERNSAVMFEDFYNSAMGLYNDVSKNEIELEKMQTDFATGATDDYLSIMLAQQKAETSLQFTIQVTSKVIEAYKEIMRIQV